MTAAGMAWGHAQALLTHYSRYWRLMRLHRPIGIWLLLWPTLWALWIASAGRPDAKVFLILVLGTIVVRSAGCVINDFADRKIDPHVARTADRPLATGEVAPAEALILFGALMVIVILVLVIWRCLRVAQKAQDVAGMTIAYGVATLVFFQGMVNIGVNLNIVPVSGLPLPFISYGGSGLTSLMLGIGLVQSVAMRQKQLDF